MSDLDPCLIPPLTHSLDNELVYEWTKKFEGKLLNCFDFKQHWAKHVPEIFVATDSVESMVSNSEKEQLILLAPLERFICGGKDPSVMFEDLKKLNDTPSLCGKVFKNGEPTYLCRDCGLDGTCVLCVECFIHSEHRNHRYKMSASSGGGYCDCGDEEAFKSDSHCKKHAKPEITEDTTPLDRLPVDLIDRLRFILKVVLNYCHTMLTWEHAINLPPDLQNPSHEQNKTDLPDTYCTVLYNDETHTYEQVIDTLSKAISCGKKVAVTYATTIDREGRSILKCSTFSACNQVRHYIERVTSRLASKLKVLVMHTEVVAHQAFALKLISWLQGILAINKGFCHIFTNAIMEDELLERIMLVDTQLWKTARNQWHQLFIVGMMMELTCKKAFAKSFISVYPTLMMEFIADDHEHSISIISSSVQIFTVPTLAHALIQEENALVIVLRSFLLECEKRHLNELNKLHFQRNLNHNSFRRAQYMLYDLGYLLAIVPHKWNDAIRKNFCKGLESFFSLLNMMQEMGPVVRQVGQHVEFEAEWETGINLQLKMAFVETLYLKWCCSDSAVFVKAVRATIKKYQASQLKPTCVGVELGNHSASCILYDVASEPVSMYLPLIRFAAGLLLKLDKFGFSYEDPQLTVEGMERPSPVQLMELPLRTLVMTAQFRAGMWRRNGYSLLNQMFFYQNVRLRGEMYDRDVLMLQVIASMIESNEFLIHLIYKFGLMTWADENWNGVPRRQEEDNTRQITTVAEEFLNLVLIIVSERFTPGLGKVTQQETVKKEIMQLLFMEPMPHSHILKFLPKDPNMEIGIESCINEVATLKMPVTPGVGKYELKPEFYKFFNPFYYHYTKEEQSKAEESQMKRKKQAGEEVCCPPPVPPEFTPRFQVIINLLQCDVMLHLMHVVLERTLELHFTAFSESQLEKVLHLIGVALHEEERLKKTEKENSFFCFTTKASRLGFLNLLEECLKSPRVDVCGEHLKDLLTWVINKYKYVEALQAQTPVCEQTLESDSSVASTSASKASARDRKRKTEIAAARRLRIMAQMSAMQKNFIKEHADMFEETLLEDSHLTKSEMELCSELSNEDPVCFRKDSSWKGPVPNVYTCILCREDQELSCEKRTLVLSTFVQKSSILSKNRRKQLPDPLTYDLVVLPADLRWSVHTSTCGHVMHSDCWHKFFESVVHKEQRRPARFGRHTSFDVEKKEFLCPLCERLSNTVIPLIPPLSTIVPADVHMIRHEITIDNWLNATKRVCEDIFERMEKGVSTEGAENSIEYLPYHYCVKHNIREVLNDPALDQFESLHCSINSYSWPVPGIEFSGSLGDMMKVYAEATYMAAFNTVNAYDDRMPPLCWSSVMYTIHAMEWLLRDKKKALFGAHSSRNAMCLESIIRFCGTSIRIFDQCVVRTHYITMLRYLFLNEQYLSSKLCCLDHDAFSLMAFLVLASPVFMKENRFPQPLGNVQDKYIVHTMLVFHFVQVLLTYPFHEEESMDVECSPAEGGSILDHSENVTALLFYEELRTAAGFDNPSPAPSGHTISQRLKAGSLPFLRCCAIFFQILTDTPPPAALQAPCDKEFETICKFLGLATTLDELLAPTSLKHLALSWARHPRTLHLLLNLKPSENSVLIRHPVSLNRLIDLPQDYSVLLNLLSDFRCPVMEGDDGRNPTMCLVCGDILCSQSYCCQVELKGAMVGACTNHAHYCGMGVGVFLRIRDCKVLLLSDKNKGCFIAPPYVDEYGETDQGLHRGFPLRLCPERYAELQELWLSHNIPEKVSHNMDQTTSVPNWQLL